MVIEKFVVLGDSENWRLLVISNRKEDLGIIFHMRCTSYDANRGHLLIESGVDMEMIETQPTINPLVHFFKRDKHMWVEQVNVRATIGALKPFMTVGQLKDFITSSHLHDYIFGVDPSNPTRSGGAQHWILCLLSELEVERRVTPGTVESLRRVIQLRFAQLKDKAEEDPKYGIEWPTILGHFRSAKLRWTGSHV